MVQPIKSHAPVFAKFPSRFDRRVANSQICSARRPDGRSPPCAEGGKSGLHGGTVPGNARRGRPQGKCHRKYTAGPSRNTGRAARVKRCGKSAPRRRQRRRQGKPHREQDQVGAAGIPLAGMPGGPSRRRSGRSHEALGNGRPRGMAIPARGSPQAGQNPAYTPSGALFKNISRTHAGNKKKLMVLFRKPIDTHIIP